MRAHRLLVALVGAGDNRHRSVGYRLGSIGRAGAPRDGLVRGGVEVGQVIAVRVLVGRQVIKQSIGPLIALGIGAGAGDRGETTDELAAIVWRDLFRVSGIIGDRVHGQHAGFV